MDDQILDHLQVNSPHCFGMSEHSSAGDARQDLFLRLSSDSSSPLSPLDQHLLHDLAYTVGSALGSEPPSDEECLASFTSSSRVSSLTDGARAWSKHHHRSLKELENPDGKLTHQGWWGTPSGPVSIINEKALILFWKIMNNATWRNLHWLPHGVLVYEIRIEEGYGMRWSQDPSLSADGEDNGKSCQSRHTSGNNASAVPWKFRGFVEPMMENGHETGWRH